MKKTILVVALVALVAAGFLFAAPAAAQDENLKRAESAMRSKQWDNAIRYAQASVDEYPEWFWGHYYLGKAYLGKGDYDRAIRNITKSLDYAEGADESFQGKFDLALSYYRKSDFANTLKTITSAERNKNSKYYNQASGQLAIMAGFSNYNLGKYKEAIDAFKPAVDSGKANADVLRAVAKSYLETNQGARSTEIMQRVVQTDPNDMASHKILIKSYINAKQYRPAVGAADNALKVNDRDWELYHLKGIALAAQKNNQAAIAAYRSAMAIQTNEDLHREIAKVYLDSGDWLNATNHYNAAQKKFAGDGKFFTEWGYCWFQYVPKEAEKFKGTAEEGKYKTALDNAKRILENARGLKGADVNMIATLLDGVNNKRERLEKGETTVEEYEVSIDPNTGEIIRKKIEPKKQ